MNRLWGGGGNAAEESSDDDDGPLRDEDGVD